MFEKRSPLKTVRIAATWAGLAVALWACVLYLVAMRPYVESVDFFHCVCYARDMLHFPHQVPESGYRYFPGIYAFWRAALRLTDGSLPGLQWTYLGVLTANAVLIGCTVFRGCRVASAAAFSGIWYLVLCSRFEGFTAETEPMATLPFLAGVLVWGGRPLKGKTGYISSALLGVGLGLALYFKQQAGLLSLGAVSLLLNLVVAPRERRHEIGPLLLIPIAALAAFLLAIQSEGKGLLPIEVGLSQVSTYHTESSLWQNLYAQVRNDESAALAAVFAVVAWLALLVRHGRRLIGESWMELVSFLLIAALASIVQFRWRGYYHYALLAIPCLVIATVVLGVWLFRMLPARVRTNELVRLALLACAAFPLFYTGGSTSNLRVWHITEESDFVPHDIWRKQPHIAADLEEIRHFVQPGDEVLVLPIRRNSIHFVLGSRVVHFPNGYYWDPEPQMLNDALASGEIPAVLVLTQHDAPGDEENWEAFQTDDVVSRLPSLGFHPVVELSTMSLWRRATPPVDR